MVTVHRQDGLRFVIYVNDHRPAHLHVYGDGEARIDIASLQLLSVRGMSRRDVLRAVAIVAAHQDEFLERWESIHG